MKPCRGFGLTYVGRIMAGRVVSVERRVCGFRRELRICDLLHELESLILAQDERWRQA